MPNFGNIDLSSKDWLIEIIQEHYPSVLKCDIQMIPGDYAHGMDFIFNRKDHDLFIKFTISSEIFLQGNSQQALERLKQILMMELRRVDKELGQLPTHDELYKDIMDSVNGLYDRDNYKIVCNSFGFKMLMELIQGKQLYHHPDFSETVDGKAVYKIYGVDISLEREYEDLKFPFYAIKLKEKPANSKVKMATRNFEMHNLRGVLKVEVKKSFIEELEESLMQFNQRLDSGELTSMSVEDEIKELRKQVNAYTELLSYKMQDANKAIRMLEMKARDCK